MQPLPVGYAHYYDHRADTLVIRVLKIDTSDWQWLAAVSNLYALLRSSYIASSQGKHSNSLSATYTPSYAAKELIIAQGQVQCMRSNISHSINQLSLQFLTTHFDHPAYLIYRRLVTPDCTIVAYLLSHTSIINFLSLDCCLKTLISKHLLSTCYSSVTTGFFTYLNTAVSVTRVTFTTFFSVYMFRVFTIA